jgi:hypothetical protein
MKKTCPTFLVFVFLLLGLALCGCSKKVNVHGKVEFPDGSPLTRGTVCVGNDLVTYMGTIRADGTFSLGEIKDGDGIPPGSYKVWIANANTTDYDLDEEGRPQSNRMISSDLVDPKFTSSSTSDLTVEVKHGERKSLNITVTAP